MSTSIINLSIFISVALAVLAVGTLVFDIFLRNPERVNERIRAASRDRLHQKARESNLFADFGVQPHAATSIWQRLHERLQIVVEQAGVGLKSEQLIWISVIVAVAIGAATIFWSTSAWFAGLAACGAAIIPLAIVLRVRQRRRALLCRQLPEAFDTMSRALRSGQTVPSAFQMVANEMPMPIGEEFALCYEQQHLGIEYEVSLRDLARRTGIIETQIFVVALIVNRQTGGNLAELLDGLAGTMRKREKFWGHLRALTGEGRMQAVVLIALPIVALGGLWLFDQSYVQALLDRPKILIATGISELLGMICIHRIVNFQI